MIVGKDTKETVFLVVVDIAKILILQTSLTSHRL